MIYKSKIFMTQKILTLYNYVNIIIIIIIHDYVIFKAFWVILKWKNGKCANYNVFKMFFCQHILCSHHDEKQGEHDFCTFQFATYHERGNHYCWFAKCRN